MSEIEEDRRRNRRRPILLDCLKRKVEDMIRLRDWEQDGRSLPEPTTLGVESSCPGELGSTTGPIYIFTETAPRGRCDSVQILSRDKRDFISTQSASPTERR
ncbi:hypothetical protein C0Q70_11354 [Pomacea canaliculata]|uniref:Uncharacterized protein n=1 Tax=Pomacea canaliculata TaxID=400727 RepID=A0A2T7P5Q6_POMCA|nr:hypothetical protein C0Q70_11354 [Pomacea canaliculata]